MRIVTLYLFEWLVDRATIIVLVSKSLSIVLYCIVCRQTYIKDTIYYSFLLKFHLNLSLTANSNMLPRVKGSDSSKVGELSMFDDKDPITWKFFFRIYLAQFMGYIEVIEMPIPEDESEEECAERINQYGKINGKLIAMADHATRIPSVETY